MNKRYEYLLNLKEIKATIHLLEIVTEGNLEEREMFYIEHFRNINPNLTNMTNGGPGKCTSLYYTEEEKIKFVQLKELQPYHWTKAYPAEELEHWNE